jgi:hypothetical protein
MTSQGAHIITLNDLKEAIKGDLIGDQVWIKIKSTPQLLANYVADDSPINKYIYLGPFHLEKN